MTRDKATYGIATGIVHLARPRFNASTREHTDLLERFYQAAGSGDMDRLISLLSSDVVMHTVRCAKRPPARGLICCGGHSRRDAYPWCSGWSQP
jgi:ketosteroid isomerase-like protein